MPAFERINAVRSGSTDASAYGLRSVRAGALLPCGGRRGRLRRSCRHPVVLEMRQDCVIGFPSVREAGGHAEVDGVG